MSSHNSNVLDLTIQGMDCPGCAAQLEAALTTVPGVLGAQVLLSSGRARVTVDSVAVTPERLGRAVEGAGYRVAPDTGGAVKTSNAILAVVPLATVGLFAAEQFGLLDRLFAHVPSWLVAPVVLALGWNGFRSVWSGLRQRQVTSHALLVVGVMASVSIGEWTTALMVALFMRFAEWIEGCTIQRSRKAVQDLLASRPATARVLCAGIEIERAIEAVRVGDLVLVRPGEQVPVDGQVVSGSCAVNEAAITGESQPADKSPGDEVFAATTTQGGFLTVRATRVGADTTFARIVRLVEESEAHKAPVQRLAAQFTAYYLPVVLFTALATYLATGQITSAVSVMVVACACAIALATPVVVLASVGGAARRGLLIKGGAALEQLARVDTLVLDKTGTVTHGAVQLSDVLPVGEEDCGALILTLAGLQSRSEHPLAQALVRAAGPCVTLPAPDEFQALPGRGVVATLSGEKWLVGSARLMRERGVLIPPAVEEQAHELEAAGKTAFYAARSAHLTAVLGTSDTLRQEVVGALDELRGLGLRRVVLLTGDNERVAAAVAGSLGVEYRAGLLPEEKLEFVRALQAEGRRVLMVGDGVNDAPALAQADVGVAMGGRGAAVSVEAADVVLMRDDWRLVPESVRVGRRAARTIRQNLAFTAVYNLFGLGFAAGGLLPPVWAAALHNLPDLAIMLNSARLLRVPRPTAATTPPGVAALTVVGASGCKASSGHGRNHNHPHEPCHTHCCADA